jgi:PhoD-like phosphatase
MRHPARRRYTRGALVGGGVVAAVAVIADWRRARGGRPAPHQAETGFGQTPARSGWGGSWYCPMYGRTLRTGDGGASIEIPRGLPQAAPDQPTPVLLLDHDHGDGSQTMVFQVSHVALRPGLLVRATTPYSFAGVTLEGDTLVVADYRAGGRTTVAAGPTAPLGGGKRHHLEVRVRGSGVVARAWPDGSPTPGWQARGQIETVAPGAPGVLVVQPAPRRPCVLTVERHTLSTGTPPRPTPPACPVVLSGVPQLREDGAYDVRLRIWSAYPSRVTFEWSESPEMRDARRAASITAGGGPPAAAHTVVLQRGVTLHWRARLRSVTSGAETVTDVHTVSAPRADAPITLLAASCWKLIGPPPNHGFQRLLGVAERPAALVFQGDMGYPNDVNGAVYAAEPDYFYDRFVRFMTDPGFVELRRSVPTGFTIDDHDYGPEQNATRLTFEPWAIALWNRLHADPNGLGYFDFRIGDVHCLTLDGRRYADPAFSPDTPPKTKLGANQRGWMQDILETSDAAIFVVFSADIFATRWDHVHKKRVRDTFLYGWPEEYRRVMSLFMETQLRGKRVVIVSGDAHSLRIHHHPDPLVRPSAAGLRVTELICSGLRAELWSGAAPDDPTLDPTRHRLGVSGGGVIEIDPAGPRRSVRLRAIDARPGMPYDVWEPLVLPFSPSAQPT